MTEPTADTDSQLDFAGLITPKINIAKDLLLLFAACAFFNLLQFQTAEFFRHTEADRALISWEMLESGNYLIPHLLGSEILTKPPLFYWLVALSFKLFGTVSEFSARFPSICCASLLVFLQYFVSLKAGASRHFSLLSALFLVSGPLYLTLSTVAEIDMTFGLLNAASIYSAFLGVTTASPFLILSSYLLAALAFLTKGPPVILFFGATLFIFSAWLEYHRQVNTSTPSLRSLIPRHLAGISLFVVVVACWVIALASTVSWEAVQNQFRVEIVERVVSESRRGRGPLFYPWSLFVSLLPWSIFFVAGFAAALSGRFGLHFRVFRSASRLWLFFLFNLIVVTLAVIVLSFAAGKSTRYIFPAYPSAVQLCVLGLMFLSRSTLKGYLYRAGTYIAAGAVLPLFLAPFFLNLKGVPVTAIAGTAFICFLVLIYLHLSCKKRDGRAVIVSLLLLMAVFRIGDRAFYVPHQNSTRQVSSIAQEINSLIPKDATIYTIELYERWFVFYLKQLGRSVIRLTPELRFTAQDNEGWVYVLLNFDLESWRLAQLSIHEGEFRVISDIKRGRDETLVVAIRKEALEHLTIREEFPVTPSPPFYGEPFAATANLP